MNKPVLVIGATSGIAKGISLALAANGYKLYLAGRNADELERICNDLKIRNGADATWGIFDGDDNASHEAFLKQVIDSLGGLHGVVYAVGDMGDQQKNEADFESAQQIIQRNFVAAASVLGHCANHFTECNNGFIIGLSSVAGDRGRQSNYIYGSAKSALSTYLEGLRNRLQPHGVKVLTVKPGFVDTAMTFGLPGLFLVADPKSVGRKIVSALDSKSDTIYLPWFWRYIMMIIRHIPEFVFKRLKL